MIKLIILIGLVYLGYRLFMGPPLLSEVRGKRIKDNDSDDDFVDYEEID